MASTSTPTFAKSVLRFYSGLRIDTRLPKGVVVLNPYEQNDIFSLVSSFYKKYYNDHQPRTMIIGINPGRFGAGVTGVPFTDPVKLETICGIPNDLPKKTELSADFIHEMISRFGGCDTFFSKFYINSVSPLGFTFEGKNLNYYDHPVLLERLQPFIISSLKEQRKFGVDSRKAFCLGEGENFRQLVRINERERLFDEIVPLAHPRFIMQYRRRTLENYFEDYLKKLGSA